MQTSKGKHFFHVARFIILPLMLIVITIAASSFAATDDNAKKVENQEIPVFRNALKKDDPKASAIGKPIFEELRIKYRNNVGFGTYTSKLNAAEFLAKQMESQLKKATSRHMLAVTSDVLGENKNGDRDALSVAPAKSFYETSEKLFSKQIVISELESEEKTFLAQYYDLNLRTLTGVIAKAGQALAIADPAFTGMHNYVLVLPLLHASEKKPLNIDVLPRWSRQSEQLDIFSDSCLLHFGFPFHAMTLAKESARKHGKTFSEIDFYKSAANKCKDSHPNVATNCLQKAVNHAPSDDVEAIVSLHFATLNVWLDSGNYQLAAGQAQKIFQAYPEHGDAGKAIWLYHYALSRSNNVEEILSHIDTAIEDKRSGAYKPKLMYIKWWALRRKRDESARVAALEYELLKLYGNNQMVAPILLSQATDLLARQDYNGAYESLTTLVNKFPSTKAANQAKRMLEKLKSTIRK
jgi:tetratricopeptide (TPR) repeat protein